MMKGHKWRFFCLDISFIGWYLLAVVFTFGIGLIALYPYREAAFAAFYDDIANRGAAKETVFPSLDPDDYLGAEDMADFDATAPDPEPVPATEPTETDFDAASEEPEEKGEQLTIDTASFATAMDFPSLDLDDYTDDDDGLFHRSFKKKSSDENNDQNL